MKTKLLFLLMLVSSLGFGQAATATWALTADASVAVTGNVSATGQSVGTSIGPVTWGATNGSTCNTWNSVALSSTAYYQYSITPTSGNNLTVNAVSFFYSVSGGSMNAAVYYSTNNFTSSTQLGTDITGFSNTSSTAQFTNSPTILVSDGTTLQIRVYGWGASANTRTFRNKTFVISGTTASTSAASSSVAALAGGEPTSISSLITTQAAAVSNFNFTVTDDTANNDALPTLITQIVIPAGTGNDVAILTDVIAGAELSDGTNSMTGTVNASNITFSSINTATLGNIADGGSKNYTLKVWLKTTLTSPYSTTVDGLNLAFKIDRTNITTDVVANSTQMQSGAGTVVESGGTNNAVAVTATKLTFVAQPTTVNQNATMSPSVTLSANDDNNNRDLDYTTNVALSSTGTMTGAPISVAAIAGLVTYSGIVHTAAGTGRFLSATSGSLTASGNSTSFNVNALVPSISVTTYAHNSTYGFGNQALQTNTDVVLTINNIGGATMNISSFVFGGAGFALQGVAPTTIGAGLSTTFTVRFTPTAIAPFTGSVTINSDASNQAAYIINFTGSGVPSNTSDIVLSGMTYISNIDYKLSQAVAPLTNTTGNIGVMGITIRDGGSSTPDNDILPTILNSITFSSITGTSMIRTAALFEGNTMIANAPTINVGANTIAFSGLSYSCGDNSTRDLTLRVSFLNTAGAVTDNLQMIFTVTNANVAVAGSNTSSSFAAFASVVSSTTSDRNRIEVTADRLLFVQNASDVVVNGIMATVTVSANDSNGYRDLDFATPTTITSNGTLTGTPVSGVVSAGLITFSGLVHTVAENGRQLTVATSGLLFNSSLSTTFAVTVVIYTTNDYRSITGTGLSWGTAAHWQRFNGTTFNAAGADGIPSSVRNVYIFGSMSTGSITANKIIIESSGVLTVTGPSNTTAQTLVKAGGVLQANFSLTNNGTFEVEDNGTVIVNYLATNASTIWNGIEIFKANSNFIINEWAANGTSANRPLFNGTNISTNTYNGYTAAFGNLSIDLSTSTQPNTFVLISTGVTANLAHNDIVLLSPNSVGENVAVLGNGSASSGIGGDFIVDDLYTPARKAIFSSSGALDFTIKGNLQLDGATTNITTSTNATNFTLTVEGDLIITAGAVLDFVGTSTANPIINLNLKGDINVVAAGLLRGQSNGASFNLNFTGTGDGLTSATTQTIDIASTSTTENSKLNFNVKNGAYVQLANRNFELGTDSKVTVEGGGVFDFGFTSSTPLLVSRSGVQTGTAFASLAGSTLRITSVDGISTGGTTGNVQVVASNTSFNSVANFHYIGKANQVTGDGIGASSSGKAVIVELNDNSLQLAPSQSFGITNASNTFVNGGLGGLLNIKKGQFVETTTALITGSTGGLTMADGTRYVIPSLSSSASDVIPRLDGLSSTYTLSDNSTIELNGVDGASAFDQYLRGNRSYKNLTFSTSGIKTISSAISSITGTITVANAAILNVEDKGMGGSGTLLTMTGTSQYITAGTGVKPDASGLYDLGTGTKVTFTSGSTAVPISTLQSIRLAPNYYNIDIVGNNVGTNSLTSAVTIKAGGTFTVKPTGVFKHSNTAGFSGASNTAISNTNSPTITLEALSTIEYAGVDQAITLFSPFYRNLTISGTGTKTLQDPTQTFINEDLNVNGGILLVNNSEVLTVRNAVKIAIGVIANATTDVPDFQIKNNAQLIQIDDASVNTGTNVKVERIATVAANDYVFWSSPLANFDIAGILDNNRYFWNPQIGNANTTVGNWNIASGFMQRATGYIVRSSTSPSITTTFSNGIPFNGSFTKAIFRGNYNDTPVSGINIEDDNWNLLGNPYPSAISADKFLDKNATGGSPKIDYALWVWKHGIQPTSTTSPYYANFVSNYSTADYIKYNAMGSTEPTLFTGFIASGQGFMVNMLHSAGTFSNTITGGTFVTNDFYVADVTFENNMRYTNTTFAPYINTQFLRPSADGTITAQTAEVEKHRIWLNIANGSANQADTMLLGYASDATLGRDRKYDCFYGIGSALGLYSLVNAEPFIIQGRPFPFDANDQVPLGMKIATSGTHTIAIHQVDGLFSQGQAIYLQDNLLNIIHDLRQAPYVFSSPIGVFNNRFVVRYTNNALNNPDFETLNNSVVAATNHGELTITSAIENITAVTVYDLLGRRLLEAKGINSFNFAASAIAKSTQTLIVKITLENGTIVTRKVIL